MKRSTDKLTAYTDGRFKILVVESETSFEAWITCEPYGIAEFMFGAEKRRLGDDSFIDIVKANLEEQEKLFLEAHEEN